jgi:uncharacterized protein YjiS (DUF1127 family)
MMTLGGKLLGPRLAIPRRAGPAGVAPRIAGVLPRVLAAVRAMQVRDESRRALADLDDRLLRDIGLDRAEAAQEANKPFWRD